MIDVKISKMLRVNLTDEDFTEPNNVLIFQSIIELIVSENKLPDIRAIAENYCRKTGCAKVDSIEILRGLITATPATSGISCYCDVMKNRKQKRKELKT